MKKLQLFVAALCMLVSLFKCNISNANNIIRKPLMTKKSVIAHYMPGFFIYKNNKAKFIGNKNQYRPDSESSEFGGAVQNYPLVDGSKYPKPLKPQNAALEELKAAKKMGIDAFHFLTGMEESKAQRDAKKLKSFFKAADLLDDDFKFTFCITGPKNSGTVEERIAGMANYLKKFFKVIPINNKHWYKTDDGRLIIFIYMGEQLSEAPAKVRRKISLLKALAKNYDKAAKLAGVSIAYVYPIRLGLQSNDAYIKAIFDNFAAAWAWRPTEDGGWKSVDSIAKKKNQSFIRSIAPDSYTSKIYYNKSAKTQTKNKKSRRFHYANNVKTLQQAGFNNLWRRTDALKLSREFRHNLESIIANDDKIISVTSWNDYPEGHNMAPDINHNFAFGVLLNYYKKKWHAPAYIPTEDIGLVFFKKYKHDVAPIYWNYTLKGATAEHDFIEGVALLKGQAKLYLNGKYMGIAKAGLTEVRIPIMPGAVNFRAVRNGVEVFNFTAPEWITDKPYRTDRLTFAFSSKYDRLWKNMFGKRKQEYSHEYAKDKDAVPFWKKEYKIIPPKK